MHRLTIGQGNNEYSIDIENYKYLIGNNVDTKFQIYNIIKNHFLKMPSSDFAIEQHYKRELLFDGRAIDTRSWRFFEVSPHFDLEIDLKMGTKSLLAKYLDSFSDILDYSETMDTISILVNSLNDDFFDKETEINFGDKTIKLHLGNITRNILFKEVSPIISNEQSECNSADLNYEEMIILQLKIIGKILSRSKDKFSLIYAIIPKITKKIEVEILGMKYENSFLIIETNDLPKENYKNIAICSSQFIDLSNDEMIIDRIMDFPFHTSKEDVEKTLKNYFLQDYLDFDNKIIVALFS